MNNKEVNQMVSNIWKELKKLSIESNGMADNYNWSREAELKKQLETLTTIVGAVEVMSKNSLLKLVSMQSTHRFMPHHSFLIQFSKACDALEF